MSDQSSHSPRPAIVIRPLRIVLRVGVASAEVASCFAAVASFVSSDETSARGSAGTFTPISSLIG